MLYGLVSILLTVLLFAFLISGLVLSRKHSFTAGVYFFLILIVHKISSYFYSLLIRNYINTLTESGKEPPMGMSIGELVSWFSLIPTSVYIIAFGVLIIGLYNMRKSKIAM
ncbi:hypothetical protein [Lederbergia graminis]|uniref:NADH dehydrogenase subunit 6 n=1 Tax=Lederbergia graminis TaxID=735518 RepID=A0ABW0LHJ5_9BACI